MSANVREVSGTDFQRGYGDVLYRVQNKRETVIITAHGRPQAVVMSLEEYAALQSAQAELARIRRGGAL